MTMAEKFRQGECELHIAILHTVQNAFLSAIQFYRNEPGSVQKGCVAATCQSHQQHLIPSFTKMFSHDPRVSG